MDKIQEAISMLEKGIEALKMACNQEEKPEMNEESSEGEMSGMEDKKKTVLAMMKKKETSY